MKLTNKGIVEVHDLSFEAERLAKGSSADRKKADVLLQRINSIRQIGLSTEEMRGRYIEALGEEIIPALDPQKYKRAWLRYLHSGVEEEFRDFLAGSQSITWTQGAAGGFTVPQLWEGVIFETFAQTDPLLDPAVCDFRVSDKPGLGPCNIVGWDLSQIAATVPGEAQQQTSLTIPTPKNVLLKSALTYRTTLGMSLEFEGDSGLFENGVDKMIRAGSVGIARKLGSDCVTGTNVSSGLLSSLTSSYTTSSSPVISLYDIAGMFFAVNRAYRAQPSCGWLMNDLTYEFFRTAVDSNNRPLINVLNDCEVIMGKRVYISPSMPTPTVSPVAAGKVIFGDLSALHIRMGAPTLQRVQNSALSAMDITFGKIGYILRAQADCAYLDPSNGASAPLVLATVTG